MCPGILCTWRKSLCVTACDYSCKINSWCSAAQLCPTLCDPWTVACQAPLSMDLPDKNTTVGFHFLLQGIFLTQGLDPQYLYWQAGSLSIVPPGKPHNPNQMYPRSEYNPGRSITLSEWNRSYQRHNERSTFHNCTSAKTWYKNVRSSQKMEPKTGLQAHSGPYASYHPTQVHSLVGNWGETSYNSYKVQVGPGMR